MKNIEIGLFNCVLFHLQSSILLYISLKSPMGTWNKRMFVNYVSTNQNSRGQNSYLALFSLSDLKFSIT